MTDQTSNAQTRLDEFEAEVAELRTGGGSANPERRGMMLGAALLVAAVVIDLVAFIQSGSVEDARDQRDLIILALFGVVLAICGAAIFLRYSLSRWFRYWLVRLIYEERAQADRIVKALEK